MLPPLFQNESGALLVPPTSFHPEEADNPIRPVDILSLKMGPSPYRRSLMPTLEEPAREQIDVMLIACGWAIQDCKSSNLGANRGSHFARSRSEA